MRSRPIFRSHLLSLVHNPSLKLKLKKIGKNINYISKFENRLLKLIEFFKLFCSRISKRFYVLCRIVNSNEFRITTAADSISLRFVSSFQANHWMNLQLSSKIWQKQKFNGISQRIKTKFYKIAKKSSSNFAFLHFYWITPSRIIFPASSTNFCLYFKACKQFLDADQCDFQLMHWFRRYTY